MRALTSKLLLLTGLTLLTAGCGGQRVASPLQQAIASPTGVPSKLVGRLLNSEGAEVRPEDLRFLFDATLSRNTRVLVAIQPTDAGSYFYVWNQAGSWQPYSLQCHGILENAGGVEVPARSLKFALSADLDGDGDSEIVGLQSGTNWMYAWPLAACRTAAPSPAFLVLKPESGDRNLNGFLRNRTGFDVPVDQLKFVPTRREVTQVPGSHPKCDPERAARREVNSISEYLSSIDENSELVIDSAEP